MKRIFSIVLLAVFLFSTTTVCYAADISSENDEDEVFDIFASDIDIPAFPSGYDDYSYICMAQEQGSGKYILVYSTVPGVMKTYYDWGHALDFETGDSVFFEWSAGKTDSWEMRSYGLGHLLGYWDGFDETNGFPGDAELKKMVYCNYTIVNSSDKDIYYFATPAIKSLSYQWAISNMIQMLCRISVLVIPVVLLILSVYFLIHQIKKVFRHFSKGVYIREI